MPKIRSKGFSMEDIRNSACAKLNQHLFPDSGNIPTKSGIKKPKYRNKKTEVDGIVFDSAKEAKRYQELKILLKAGEIGFLELQVPFELNQGGTHSMKYVADFVYIDAKSGTKIVEDVKGYRTKEYRKKKKLMKNLHRIIIKEI
jgi:hypothetical protein